MRRIPRPQRAIDASLTVSPLLQRRIAPQACLRAPPHLRLGTAAACFSTTPAVNFLLSGKADKKKHQQFVRRWQKRLVGDSEPIGAHVDPYDPTSPVRIAPEEQGAEVEVLNEEAYDSINKIGAVYREAPSGLGLLHVGGKQWTDQLEEGAMAKEFEKLTMRTYTPLTLNMADQIEDLTGTPYTLRDNNLMMAQTFHDFTNKPYTDTSFGLWTRVRNIDSLRQRFHRAVVEIYALKEAGKNLDISNQVNRGIYDPPTWMDQIKLHDSADGKLALSFPGQHTLETLIECIERVPEWSPEEDVAVDQPQEDLVTAVADENVQPQMDPETPAYKRAALVKEDPDRKPFDFMSNRPVPKANPAEPTPEAADKASKPDAVGPTDSPSKIDVMPETLAGSKRLAQEERSDILKAVLAKVEHHENLMEQIQKDWDTILCKSDGQVKWRHVPLTDLEIKFALSKRLTQLTGHYILDPNLSSASTLGDLYGYLCAAAKPAMSKLHKYINVEGSRQNRKAKMVLAEQHEAVSKSKAGVGDLLKLGNVEVFRKRPNRKQQRVRIGLDKVVRQALAKRDLFEKKSRKVHNPIVFEGTRHAPDFGVPVSSDAAQKLHQRTDKKRMELEAAGMDMYMVDKLIRNRNSVKKQASIH